MDVQPRTHHPVVRMRTPGRYRTMRSGHCWRRVSFRDAVPIVARGRVYLSNLSSRMPAGEYTTVLEGSGPARSFPIGHGRQVVLEAMFLGAVQRGEP